MFEHICFHYRTLGSFSIARSINDQKMLIINRSYKLPVFNADEIPTDESYQTIGCFQEVIDEDGRRGLIYFDSVVKHCGL